jgi:hypothetical protein
LMRMVEPEELEVPDDPVVAAVPELLEVAVVADVPLAPVELPAVFDELVDAGAVVGADAALLTLTLLAVVCDEAAEALVADEFEALAAVVPPAAVVVDVVAPAAAAVATATAPLLATAFDVAAVVPVLEAFAGLCKPVPPCGPVMTAVPVPVEAKSGRFATVLGSVISPRTSIVVSRAAPYAMPPGARMLLLLIDVTTSPSVKFSALSLFGSTSTSIAGVTVPFALTFETPSICSSSGTMLFVMMAESAACVSDFELAESVATTVCAGSKVPIDGAARSVGRMARVDCTRRCTSTRSLV